MFLDAWNSKSIDDIKDWFDNVSEGRIHLKSFGVGKEDIPKIVKLATTSGRMDNNPIVFDEEEIRDILESVNSH